MKKIQYILLAALVLGTVACSDSWMTTQPEGATKTADQKAKAEQQNADAAAANINAMYANFIALYGGAGDMGYSRHNDFGYSAICIFTEAQGMDFIGQNIGYNWFSQCLYSENRANESNTAIGLVDHIIWNTYYKIINAANNVIGGIDENEPGSMEDALCQAFCVRAFAYFQLAQLYQFTYQGHENDKCVPLVVPNMPADKQLNNPRATVAEVYALISHDLDYACNSVSFASFTRDDNGFCNQAVAFGLRARVNLVKGDKAQAAADAQECLTQSGATPLSIAECGKPGFADATAHNVIWGNIIVETNDIVQTSIVNWPSHLSSFYGDGYVGVGAYRSISTDLYSKISDTDVRKGWWLNADNESPLLDVAGYSAAKENIQGAEIPHITTKFGTGDGSTSGLGAAAADWIIMRAEEMLLIIAEANNDAAALEAFVTTYRDPEYKVSGNVADAVWIQRRIELWGEGFAFQDILRLHKDIDRTLSTNWPAAWVQHIPADHGCLIYRLPQAEVEANQGISEADNNPVVDFK